MVGGKVPFVDDRECKYASCHGPQTAMMVLRFFRPDVSIGFSQIYKEMGYSKGKWFFETYIVRLLDSYEIPCVYFSDEEVHEIGKNPEIFKGVSGLSYNEENVSEVGVKNYDSAVRYVKERGLFTKRKVDVDMICEYIRKGKLVIALVNINDINGGSGYKGHFVLLKEFKDDIFVCNDSYLGEGFKIGIQDFENAFYYLHGEKKTHHIVVVG